MITVTLCQIRRHLAKRLFHYYEGGRNNTQMHKSQIEKVKKHIMPNENKRGWAKRGPPTARELAALKLKTGTEVQAAKQHCPWNVLNHPNTTRKQVPSKNPTEPGTTKADTCAVIPTPRGLASNHMHKVFKFCALSYTYS